LNTLGVSVAVVYGQNEKFAFANYPNKSSLKKWRNKIIMIPDAGHLLQYDQANLLAQLITEFTKDCFK
jgi:pimeloyl-ACP methyl ester carboxylesterase